MATRIAATFSLFCFAACLVAGLVTADHSFSTLVWRGLVAMAGTFVVGLIVGKMAETMILEDRADQARSFEKAREQQVEAYRHREPILQVGSEEPG